MSLAIAWGTPDPRPNYGTYANPIGPPYIPGASGMAAGDEAFYFGLTAPVPDGVTVLAQVWLGDTLVEEFPSGEGWVNTNFGPTNGFDPASFTVKLLVNGELTSPILIASYGGADFYAANSWSERVVPVRRAEFWAFHTNTEEQP